MDIPDHHVPQLTHFYLFQAICIQHLKMLNANCLKKIEWLSREILISNFNLGFELGFAWWL